MESKSVAQPPSIRQGVWIATGAVVSDVFVSYAREEAASAETIRRALESLSLTVFFDIERLDAGDVWSDVIDTELKSAGAVVALWSPHALTRAWVKKECGVALERGVLLPAVLKPVSVQDVPTQFADLHRVDLSDFAGQRDHPGWRSLVRALAKKLRRKDLLVTQIAELSTASPTEQIRLELEDARRELARLRRQDELIPFVAALVVVLGLVGSVLGYVELERQKNMAARNVRESLASPDLVRTLEAECASGQPIKCHNAALMLLQGPDGVRNISDGLKLLGAACDGRVGKACSDLAAYYIVGNHVPIDEARAQDLYQRGCEAGHALSCMKTRTRDAGPTAR